MTPLEIAIHHRDFRVDGKSLVIFGNPGSGKLHKLQSILDELEEDNSSLCIASEISNNVSIDTYKFAMNNDESIIILSVDTPLENTISKNSNIHSLFNTISSAPNTRLIMLIKELCSGGTIKHPLPLFADKGDKMSFDFKGKIIIVTCDEKLIPKEIISMSNTIKV